MDAANVARMRDQLFFDGDHRGRQTSRYWILLPLSGVIAAAGIVADSTATVIGAMIVAPLMVPIIGTALAVVLADRRNLIRSLAMSVAGVGVVIAIGWLLGLTIDTPIVAATNDQVAGRVQPRLIDLLAALATGAVGAVAVARKDISDTLPGVAIAISLVPPLAIIGLTLESGKPDEAMGALLLFTTNVSAILVMGLLVLTLYRVQRFATTPTDGETVHRKRAALTIVAGLLVISVPLAATSAQIASTRNTESDVRRVAEAWGKQTGWTIAEVVTEPSGVQVRAVGPMPEPNTDELRRALIAAGLGAEEISFLLVPSQSVTLTGSK